MEQHFSTFGKFYQYSKERFPIPGALAYTGAIYYLILYAFGDLFNDHQPFNFVRSLIGWAVVFFILLRLRIVDEHKDYEKDLRAYPQRLLSRGIITLKQLRAVYALAAALEIAASLYLGWVQICIWAIIFVWSLLMYVEFFVPVFLNKRMGLYLVTHQFLMPLTALYGFVQRFEPAALAKIDWCSTSLLLLGLICGTISYEIARKTWSADREHQYADSYTKIWGRLATILVNQLVAVTASAIFSYYAVTHGIGAGYLLIAGLLYLQFLLCGVTFYLKPLRRYSKWIQLSGAVFMLGVFYTFSLAFLTMPS